MTRKKPESETPLADAVADLFNPKKKTENYRGDIVKKYVNPARIAAIPKTAEAYAKMPANIRAAVAKVAQVENVGLEQLSHKDRLKLLGAVDYLLENLATAQKLLRAVKVVE